jgi:uncharacterized membrane protein YkoI
MQTRRGIDMMKFVALVVAASIPVLAQAKLPEPKISNAAATRTALASVPGGVVKSSEIETEHGKLIYSFDISVTGKSGVEEIAVDAMTGRILSRTHESPRKERAEAAQEKSERKTK